jgi:hypothetical protein
VVDAARSTDATSYISLFFVLAFLGQEKTKNRQRVRAVWFSPENLSMWVMMPLTGGCCGSAHGCHGLMRPLFLNWHSGAKKKWQRFHAGRFLPENCPP